MHLLSRNIDEAILLINYYLYYYYASALVIMRLVGGVLLHFVKVMNRSVVELDKCRFHW